REVLRDKGPVLTEILIPEDEDVLPMVPAGARLDQMILGSCEEINWPNMAKEFRPRARRGKEAYPGGTVTDDNTARGRKDEPDGQVIDEQFRRGGMSR
ncbi:MAG: hypothetical protein LBQ16_05900, partial [Gracilibacteraceae bacterium]|nr:hypothetical protein [Gracilibacteraceae bacterium]